MHKEVKRELYLQKLRFNRDDTNFIKVIEGVRRCGKSTLLHQYAEELRTSGVKDDRIFVVNMESRDSAKFRQKDVLAQYLYESIDVNERTYLFIDEIQLVPEWQLLLDGLMVDRRECDIYVTGSNAYLLSGELSTYLTGRCVEIRMLPLSFKEYTEMNGPEDRNVLFMSYIKNGAMPAIRPDWDEDTMYDHLDGLYRTIVSKDVQVRADSEISVSKLDRLTEFLMDSAGMDTSLSNMSKKLNISYNTADKYVRLLTDAYLIYGVKEYDLKGKRILDSMPKYYPVDTGIRNALVGFRTENIGRMIETIVFLELMRRGYSLTVGKFKDCETDFVAVKNGRTEYYQVSYLVDTEETLNRELEPLRKIRDSNAKFILSMSPISSSTKDGIECMNVIDWLMR